MAFLRHSVSPRSGWLAALLTLFIILAIVFSSIFAGATPRSVSAASTFEPDLGDAPDSTNNYGAVMQAYPSVTAKFPSVFTVGAPDYGQLHHNNPPAYFLGPNITAEREADIGPDADTVNNIDPVNDKADQDLADDGVRFPLGLVSCQKTTLTYQVTVVAGQEQRAFVNVWFDWNRNGVWGDRMECPGSDGTMSIADEWAVQEDVIFLPFPGTYTFTTSSFVPANIDPRLGALWMRITLSEGPVGNRDGSGPASGWKFGETEDYLIGDNKEPTPTHQTDITPTKTEIVQDPTRTDTPRPTRTATTEPTKTEIVHEPTATETLPPRPTRTATTEPTKTEIVQDPTRTSTPRPSFTPTDITQDPTKTSTPRPSFTPTHIMHDPTNTPTKPATQIPTRTATPKIIAPDLGDAPDSTNSFGIGMLAYPAVPANFPSVFGPGSPPHGPRHLNNPLYYHLGQQITRETEADNFADADGVNNINPNTNTPDLDKADDGLKLPVNFPHCQKTTITYTVRVYPGSPTTAYVNFWADLRRNGQWGDVYECQTAGGIVLAREWAVQNQVVTLPGPGFYTFTASFLSFNPTPTRPLWVRLTISDTAATAADGRGPATSWRHGETEDYRLPGILPTPTATKVPTNTATALPTRTATNTMLPTRTPTKTATAKIVAPDLGDAPDSTNSFGVGMLAYPAVPAQFPVVFGAGSPPHGPRHLNNPLLYHLGDLITRETEADLGADADGVNNIRPNVNTPNLDKGDDGLVFPVSFNHCKPMQITYRVRVYPGAPTSAYVNFWADFRRNGVWGDVLKCASPTGAVTAAPEWAVQNQLITLPGPGFYTFTSPVFWVHNATPASPMWTRLTISNTAATAATGAGPAGSWALGETEDYRIPGISTQPTPTATRTATLQVATVQPNPTINPN